MGNPKRKFSKSRRDKRAAQWKLERPDLGECPRCHEPVVSHRACPNCGYYRGREVIRMEE